MSNTQLIGKAKELQVASLLIGEGFYVYFPLVDEGFDLVASNKAGTVFVPVQVRYKKSRTGLTLKDSEIDKFRNAEVILAFGSEKVGSPKETEFWFIPFSEWDTQIKHQRADRTTSVRLSEVCQDWLKNTKDVAKVFKNLLKK